MEKEKQTSQYRLSLTKNVGVSKDSHVLSKMMSKAFKENDGSDEYRITKKMERIKKNQGEIEKYSKLNVHSRGSIAGLRLQKKIKSVNLRTDQ